MRSAIGDYPARPWSMFADDDYLHAKKEKKRKSRKSSFFGRRKDESSQYDYCTEGEVTPSKRIRQSNNPSRSSSSSRGSGSSDDQKSSGNTENEDDPLAEPVPRLVHPEALDLLGQLLTVDHTLRPSAAEAMNHPYFDPVRRRLKKIAR